MVEDKKCECSSSKERIGEEYNRREVITLGMLNPFKRAQHAFLQDSGDGVLWSVLSFHDFGAIVRNTYIHTNTVVPKSTCGLVETHLKVCDISHGTITREVQGRHIIRSTQTSSNIRSRYPDKCEGAININIIINQITRRNMRNRNPDAVATCSMTGKTRKNCSYRLKIRGLVPERVARVFTFTSIVERLALTALFFRFFCFGVVPFLST